MQSYMLRATALLPHTRYSDSEWRSFTQLSAHQVRWMCSGRIDCAATPAAALALHFCKARPAALPQASAPHPLTCCT